MEDIIERATYLAGIDKDEGNEKVMIGLETYFMSHLEDALLADNITPVYSFYKSEAVEETKPDGSVKKTMVFKHVGFVEA